MYLPKTCARDGGGPGSEAHHLAAEGLQPTGKAIFPSANGVDRNAEANCCVAEGNWRVSRILYFVS